MKYVIWLTMLIPDCFEKCSIVPKGIIHIGAHFCEEREIYEKAGCDDKKVVWIEGNPHVCHLVSQKFPTVQVYNGLISDKEHDVDFIITNNGQSSSFLELKEHKIQHPEVYEVGRIKLRTTTLPELLSQNSIDVTKYDCLMMDIQGAELHALRGMKDILSGFRLVYLEVNTKEIYAECGQLSDIVDFLQPYGFVMKDINMTHYGWGDAVFVRRS
jgi:FkbM family methyltransferase